MLKQNIASNKGTIGKIIKNTRKCIGFTQEQLAERIGITPEQLSRLEVGNFTPSLSTFLNILGVLNLTLEDFGINSSGKKNKMLDELIKLMHTLNDTEIECCYNVMKALISNFELIKKSKIKKRA